jgi:hypothetical protein
MLGSIGTDAFEQSLADVRPDAMFGSIRSGNDVVLTFTAVPKPSTSALVFTG